MQDYIACLVTVRDRTAEQVLAKVYAQSSEVEKAVSKYELALPASLAAERLSKATKVATEDDDGIEVGDKERWECLVSGCGQILLYEDLRIDPFFYDALKRYPDDEKIVVHADGTLSRHSTPPPVLVRPGENRRTCSPPPRKRGRAEAQSNDVIDVDALVIVSDSSSESEREDTVVSKGRKRGRPSGKVVVQVVDLCLSDDDEQTLPVNKSKTRRRGRETLEEKDEDADLTVIESESESAAGRGDGGSDAANETLVLDSPISSPRRSMRRNVGGTPQ
ncbi:hypothetical protein HDU93_005555 [Gonapodya sp. JEL0774]|nr:hypothetical protein HDU93_005555 [Gonapodya sp. JEL0774]